MVKGERRGVKSDLNFATSTKKRPERYETVRAFGLCVYVALNGIKPGKHTLELRVVASDHETELDAKDQIEFTVK